MPRNIAPPVRSIPFRPSWNGWIVAVVVGVDCMLAGVAGRVRAEPAAPAKANAQPSGAVAKVDGVEITRADVDIAIRVGRAAATESRSSSPIMLAQALSQMIDRRVVENHLTQKGFALSEAELDAIIGNLKKELLDKGKTWESFLTDRGINDDIARRELRWEKSWNRYLVRNFNEEKIKLFFNNHRREFDGTELRVSHVLLRPAHSGDAWTLTDLIKQAESIRAKIVASELTFAQAAEKYSAGPSRREGGDLGFVPRRGRMAEEFSKAAFALEKNQLSQPVTSSFGVHLLRWTEEKPGSKKWEESADEIKTAIAIEQFDTLSAQLRPKAKIEFTGSMPHFKPGTRELVEPKTEK